MFSWLKDDQPLVTDERVRMLDPTNSGNLRIESVEFADAGSYQCLITTTHGGLQAPLVRTTSTMVDITGQ